MEKPLRKGLSSVKRIRLSGILVVACFMCTTFPALSQGLEKVMVEKYYVADVLDASDSLAQGLKDGTVTYRIWVDMKPGYKLLAVYGRSGNELSFSTTTTFFNDTLFGKVKAPDIKAFRLGKNPLLLDSYIAFSGASQNHLAVLKEDDTNGSVLERQGKFEGAAIMDRGMLMSAHPDAGIPIRDADGLMEGGVPPIMVFGADFEEFGNTLEASLLSTTNGAWAVLKGLQGPYPEKNYILIAQVTTDGELSFKLNLQLKGPDGETEYYVAENPDESEFTHPSLVFPQKEPAKSQ